MKVILYGDWGKNNARLKRALEIAKGSDLFDILYAGAKVILRRAMIKPPIPIKTGFLRSTGDIQRDGDSPVVGFSADYAEHVEFGTSRMAARPYLRPAINEQTELIEAEMMKVVERKIQ